MDGQMTPGLDPVSHGDAAGEVMNGIAPGNAVQGSPLSAPDDGVLTPYYGGELSPINAMGDDDAGGRDDVSATVAGAVVNATARWHEFESDTFGLGSTIGDIVTLPPSALDPGVGSTGTTDPAGGFYDPPRSYE